MLTVAICTCNRADLLGQVIQALQIQECPIPFEILIVDNNSKDHTRAVVEKLAVEPGVPVHYVLESRQGTVFARNRAIEECRASLYMAFVDDDAIPVPGMLRAAVEALENDKADCAGGPVRVKFPGGSRPKWLGKELLGFLAETDYGDKAFWIKDPAQKIWTCNIIYRVSLFGDGLRFETSYNREGQSLGGGGEDEQIFDELFSRCVRIRYRPDMGVEHHVDPKRFKRSYFLRLHYRAGRNVGFWEQGKYSRTFLGVPPFLCVQALRHWVKTLRMLFLGLPQSAVMRQAMNGSHALGMIAGNFRHWLNSG